MRYLLQNCFSNELTARQQYIEKSIHLWCLPQTSVAGFEQLVSIPSTSLDVFFIVGKIQIFMIVWILALPKYRRLFS